MHIDTDHWDKQDYLAFILLYLAEADGQLEDQELQYIADHLGKEHLDHIRQPASQCNDFQCLEVMRELRPRFYPDQSGLESLKLEMTELCKAGNRFSQFEHEVIEMIAKQL